MGLANIKRGDQAVRGTPTYRYGWYLPSPVERHMGSVIVHQRSAPTQLSKSPERENDNSTKGVQSDHHANRGRFSRAYHCCSVHIRAFDQVTRIKLKGHSMTRCSLNRVEEASVKSRNSIWFKPENSLLESGQSNIGTEPGSAG